MPLTLTLTDNELATIDEARGIMTREAFISHASLQTAEDLLSIMDESRDRTPPLVSICYRIERERHER